ncbi:hypothetical protein D9758_018626 [Tetrapyrgos nigripes]|uniref:Peptidase A2 domain-containing protein n=1 Tax=Tetrapyrgos nigripes TaxID=182062 RepID=A0A8H5F094_9AGAR|nr:hypothetical protein D9758_018626 [Tetrapyrgos nigripes]
MSVITRNRQIPSITLKTELIGKVTGRKIDADALIDSGAEGIIINGQFTQKNQLTLLPIKNPFPVRNVDGSENTMGWAYHEEQAEFYVMDIGDHNIILGTDWLEEHNPDINWSDSRVDMTRCPETCITAKPPVLHLKTKSLKPTVVDPRTHHKDYQVRWLEPVGQFKPVAQLKIAGRRRQTPIRSFHRSSEVMAIFTEDDDERDTIPERWEQDVMEELLGKEERIDEEAPGTPNLNIRAGFTKA